VERDGALSGERGQIRIRNEALLRETVRPER
jgi:hypothetical protein